MATVYGGFKSIGFTYNDVFRADKDKVIKATGKWVKVASGSKILTSITEKVEDSHGTVQRREDTKGYTTSHSVEIGFEVSDPLEIAKASTKYTHVNSREERTSISNEINYTLSKAMERTC